MATKKVAVVGDQSNHGGEITTHNQDGTVFVANELVAVEGCQHSCPISGHGVTSVTAVTVKSYINNKLIITEGAQAGCGAIIQPVDRLVYVE